MGLLIEIEGCDASGKTTQAKRLANGLNAKYIHFPNYSTPIGKLIEKHLQNKQAYCEHLGGVEFRKSADDALVFQALQVANRAECYNDMNNWLKEGHVVVDRYTSSGYAYGVADGLDGDHLLAMNDVLIEADLHIYIDISEDTRRMRMEARGSSDRYEERKDLQGIVHDNYRKLWANSGFAGRYDENPYMHMNDYVNWRTVNGNGTVDEVARAIANEIWDWRSETLQVGGKPRISPEEIWELVRR